MSSAPAGKVASSFRLAAPTDADAASFCALSNSLYARPVDSRYYDWQFFQTPFPTTLTVLDDGEWIACYGMQVRPLARSDRPAAWAIDIMVAQPHQRRGLFTPLATAAADSVAAQRPAALCVMANPKADAAHLQKLGWKRAQTFFTCVADAAPYRRIVNDIDYFPINDFSSCATTRRIPLQHTRRSADYLNWRFMQNPRYTYDAFGVVRRGQPFGYLILKRFRDPVSGEEFGDIVDILWAEDDVEACEDMLRFALGRFASASISRGATWLQTNTILDEAGARAGFTKTDQQRFFCVRALDRDHAHLEDGANWFITMADAEVY